MSRERYMTVIRSCPSCEAPIPKGSPEDLCPRCLLSEALPAPETPPAFPSAAALARELPGFEIGEQLGRGGMGAVFAARRRSDMRSVAIKALRSDLAAEARFVERFAREARAMQRLDHPHILKIEDHGEADAYPYLVLERVRGQDLRSILDNSGERSPEKIRRCLLDLARALNYAHGEGIVHRDIKPENILIDEEGQPKLADFGIAKALEAEGEPTLTGTLQALGTPHYMAPELLAGGELSPAADIFSLGVVAYEWLTGRLPLGRFERPAKLDRRLAPIDALLLAMLDPKPQRRPSAGAVVAALKTAGSLRAKNPERQAPTVDKRRSYAALVIAGVVSIAASFFPWYEASTEAPGFESLRILANAWESRAELGVTALPNGAVSIALGLCIILLVVDLSRALAISARVFLAFTAYALIHALIAFGEAIYLGRPGFALLITLAMSAWAFESALRLIGARWSLGALTARWRDQRALAEVQDAARLRRPSGTPPRVARARNRARWGAGKVGKPRRKKR